jgi:putative intracellular protease/amidase
LSTDFNRQACAARCPRRVRPNRGEGDAGLIRVIVEREPALGKVSGGRRHAAGFTIRTSFSSIACQQGGAIAIDGYSDPRDASGYSAHDILSFGFLLAPHTAALLENTPKLADLNPADYDALFIAGGQSPMVTFIDDADLHAFAADFYAEGKVLAVVCHGTCILLKTRLPDGTLLVEGKTWTGFANSEEAFADGFVGMRIQPFWIEDEARKLPNTNFVVGPRFAPFAVRDGRLITGQQQYSGGAAAKLVIEALGV